MLEQRRSERVKSFLRAQILYNNRMTTVDCLVKNISADGAKIEVAQTTSIPDAFDLYIPQKSKTYHARMAWRDATSIGVSFVAADSDTPAENIASDTQSLRLRALEMQNAELKARIRDLSKRLEDLGQDPELAIRQVI
jgi:hypothetical protein